LEPIAVLHAIFKEKDMATAMAAEFSSDTFNPANKALQLMQGGHGWLW
jgi:hypothetical protein